MESLCESLSFISSKNEKMASLYISIGSAAHMTKIENEKHILEPQYDQQYPVFLRELKNKLPESPLYIYIIDPMLEDIPFIVQNKFIDKSDKFIDKSDKLEEGWEENKFGELNYYYNIEMNIHVFTMKQYVIYPYDINYNLEGCTVVDISEFFNKLNILSISNRWLSIIHDFSGKNIGKTAYLYDYELEGHLDHIIYGLGCRTDEGSCYIDLTSPECQFVYNINKDDEFITVFNPYYYKNTSELLSRYGELIYLYETESEKITIIKSQINEYIKMKKKIILDDIMVMLRRIGCLEAEKDFDVNMIENISIFLKIKTNINILEMIKIKEYRKIINELIHLLKIELTNILYVIYHDNTMNIVNIVIDNMMYNSDPYRWYMYIGRILRELKNI